MKQQGLHTQAYTIIEVLIVLAVTGALLVSAIVLVGGQSRKTEFSQAIHDIESQISDTINDVTTGFYPTADNFSCSSTGSGPSLSSVDAEQGTNEDCIFVGKVMQFGVAGSDGENYNIYSVAGQRQSGNKEAQSLDETQPTAIAPTSSSPVDFPNVTENKSLQYGLTASKMYYLNSNTLTNIGAVGFFSTFAGYDSQNNLTSGTPTVNLIPIPNTNLNDTAITTAERINALTDAALKNPSGGVIVCFQSGGTNEHGLLTLGSVNRQLTTKLEILAGTCP
jgi:type II secretory pathway pseudopilin PulG